MSSFDGELGAAEKPGGHSAGDGTETEADDEVAQAKKRCLEVEPEAAGPGGVVCCRQSRCSGGIGRNVFPALRADRGVRCGGLSVTGIGSGGGRCGCVGMCRCAG